MRPHASRGCVTERIGENAPFIRFASPFPTISYTNCTRLRAAQVAITAGVIRRSLYGLCRFKTG